MLVPHVFQGLVTCHCQILNGLMDVLVQTDRSWCPRAVRWGWWHWTPRHGLSKSKAFYKVGWVSFSPLHRWEIKAQEGFPTCKVHKSLCNPPLTIPPAAPQTQKPCLQKGRWVCIPLLAHLLAEKCHLLCCLRWSVLVLGWQVCGFGTGTLSAAVAAGGIYGESIHVPGAEMLQHLAPLSWMFFSKTPCARQNMCVGRQMVPKQLQESSSWPLIYSEVGWIGSAAVETQVDEGAGGQGW